jgi:hypothetical protein
MQGSFRSNSATGSYAALKPSAKKGGRRSRQYGEKCRIFTGFHSRPICARPVLPQLGTYTHAGVGVTAMDGIRLRPSYPIGSFCEDFGIGRSTAYAEIRAGRLKAFKIGDKTVVAGEDALD